MQRIGGYACPGELGVGKDSFDDVRLAFELVLVGVDLEHDSALVRID